MWKDKSQMLWHTGCVKRLYITCLKLEIFDSIRGYMGEIIQMRTAARQVSPSGYEQMEHNSRIIDYTTELNGGYSCGYHLSKNIRLYYRMFRYQTVLQSMMQRRIQIGETNGTITRYIIKG